jgi:hypothetical protein
MPRLFGDGLPDFKSINRIPIIDVAIKLGVEVVMGGALLCPRPDIHDKSRPALLTPLPNNKIKCDACGTGPLTVVDLLMHVGDFSDPLVAVRYFAPELASYQVPTIPKGSHLKNPQGLPVPPACDDPLRLLVVSGVWATLSETTQRLMPVFLALTDWRAENPKPEFELSYRAMTRFSGVKSPNAINESLDNLTSIGWMERIAQSPRGKSPIKDTAWYRLTPLSDRVRAAADANAPKFAKAIKDEKAVRKQEREDRKRQLGSEPPDED